MPQTNNRDTNQREHYINILPERTLYKHITECHTQTNNRDTNQREHYINILLNATHKQITVIPIRENII